MKSYSGYRKNIFEGWKKLDDATIVGDGYTVEFFRLSERTIDRMCDALNGWHNIWTRFRCDYTDEKGTLSITVRKPEDADRISKLMSDLKPVAFEHEETLPAVDVARTKLEPLIDFMKTAKQKNTPHKGKNTEMER